MASAQWADYGISAVQYDANETHINKVKVKEDKGDKFGSASEWTRSQVVNAIETGTTFVTIIKNAESKWSKGADVHIVEVNKVQYIRTDRNQTASDNLENLPTF